MLSYAVIIVKLDLCVYILVHVIVMHDFCIYVIVKFDFYPGLIPSQFVKIQEAQEP